MKKTILLTGGTGFIGSHTAVEMIQAGYRTVLCDNLSNSSIVAVDRIEEITGVRPAFYPYDAADRESLEEIFAAESIDGVVHFAGFKAVGESVSRPLVYYRNNLDATLSLLEVMGEHGVQSLVFSSSATVYGSENPMPCRETMPRGVCANPYGWTKSMIEQILSDACAADPELSVVLLRYFNPIGAHPSGRMGEDPRGIPNNLMPFICQVAVGRREELTVFGGDYNTPDGTCRRDYIHVCDLAEGHVKALEFAAEHRGVEAFNLGTGDPYSVLEIIYTFEDVTGRSIPHRIGPRREGDLPDLWADPAKAKEVLGWEAKKSLEDMCRDAWNWQKNNPRGYESGEDSCLSRCALQGNSCNPDGNRV